MSFINVWNISSKSKIDYKLEIDLRILYIISNLFGCTLFSHGILDVWCSWKNVLFRIKIWLIWHPAYNRLLLSFLKKNYRDKQKQHTHITHVVTIWDKGLLEVVWGHFFKKRSLIKPHRFSFFLALGSRPQVQKCSILWLQSHKFYHKTYGIVIHLGIVSELWIHENQLFGYQL